MRPRHATTRPRRGAAMIETLLVLPLLVLVLSMLFFFGAITERTQKAMSMARYETWRQMTHGTGPRSHDWDNEDDVRHAQLNWLFFDDRAESIVHWRTNNQNFPVEAYEQLIDEAGSVSGDAGDLAQHLIFQPSGELTRLVQGHREGFAITHPVDLPLYNQLHRPIRRFAARIGDEWRYSASRNACADTWSGGRNNEHHPRAVRDVFYEEFDAYLDGLDGEQDPEYWDDEQSSERFSPDILAGFLRSLYLRRPGYHGPIVYDERP